ncbi:MAG: hypothetical protein HDKAJFGB_01473 [Anaerolineae bacterium]|nr:hypothetical protein [Anaerolineae bacterium]
MVHIHQRVAAFGDDQQRARLGIIIFRVAPFALLRRERTEREIKVGLFIRIVEFLRQRQGRLRDASCRSGIAAVAQRLKTLQTQREQIVLPRLDLVRQLMGARQRHAFLVRVLRLIPHFKILQRGGFGGVYAD